MTWHSGSDASLSWGGDIEGGEMMERFMLIRHDHTKRNLAWLFSYAQVTQTIVHPVESVAVDIVRVQHHCLSADQIDYLAEHQRRVLDRGMEMRSDRVFKTEGEAEREAAKVVRALAIRFRDKGEPKK